MKRMLFNATHPEEMRIAIVDGQRLIDLDLESAVRAEKKGNIYKAVVTRVEPGLEAAFVNYGASRQGFLPLKEIYRGYFAKLDPQAPVADIKIAEEISEGQEMIVQVNKDERGGKGAALTTFISLAGRFLVLMPNNPKGGGISRRVSSGERAELQYILDSLNVGPRHALIVRTAGLGREQAELQWDLDFLLKLWDTIESAAADLQPPRLIYQGSNLIVRALRDHFSADISEIIVDEREIYERTKRFMQQMMPQNLPKLKFHSGNTPLFSKYQAEHQISAAFARKVSLPSGGSIVIDYTEALISVDVNSARATAGADIEETAVQTNLEAVDEIARQLRIRDLGGLVVIDLIDMTEITNQRTVETRLRAAMRPDRARVQIGKISRFGLLEMSRQRLGSSISDANYRGCPRCDGTGKIRGVVSSSLWLLRQIESRAMHAIRETLQVILPLDMATYLLNEKRGELSQLETRLGARIIIVPTAELSSPQFEIRRLRDIESAEFGELPSYAQPVEVTNNEPDITDSLKTVANEKPHIQFDQLKHVAAPVKSKPKTTRRKQPSLLQRMFNALTGQKPKPKTTKKRRVIKGKTAQRSPQRRPGRPAAARGRPPTRNKPLAARPTNSDTNNLDNSAIRPRPMPTKSAANSGANSAAPTNPANDNPPPTRRDFAAHDPKQRVGLHNPRH